MQKIYLAILAALVAGILYTFATSYYSHSAPDIRIAISVEKDHVTYGDLLNWNAKGLPADSGYVATVRLSNIALIVGTGKSDARGEATGSFGIGQNIPTGTFLFRIALASGPDQFNEVSVKIIPSSRQ